MNPPTIRPSSMPALAQCPCFASSGTPNDDTDRGTKRHSIIAELLKSGLNVSDKPELCAGESLEFAESVQWAIDYVRLHAPMHDHPLVVEQRLEDKIGSVTFGGTPDVYCGNHLFDFKGRLEAEDYTEQMLAYVLLMPGSLWQESITVHLLQCDLKKARTMTVDPCDATKRVVEIIEWAKDENRQPKLNDYCGWCANQTICPAFTAPINAVIDAHPEWQLPSYQPSDMQTSAELGQARRVAAKLVEWAEAVLKHTNTKALKEGIVADGYKIQSRGGNRTITDVAAAFSRVNLPQDVFLPLCGVSFTDLVEAYAKQYGKSKTGAEQDVADLLGDVLQRKSGYSFLTADKTKKKD